MDWLFASVWLSYMGVYALRVWEDRLHKKEIEKIHAAYAEERQELLDRIMANNMTEFKVARQEASINRSETGNFIKDRMTAAMKKQYLDE